MDKTVVELFAGVGGFRVGLNDVSLDSSGKTKEKDNFKFVWANQWEPSTKIQHAFDCYQKRFGVSEKHSNQDIAQVDKKSIPNHTLLVGGFPCQDYSVARSLSKEKGIQGKKGVLWWEIYSILDVKRPPFVLLENVDRLIKSPSMQRGRDFGIMLRTLNDLGYGVEWRVINAAEYGRAQRRRRIFIFAFHESTNYYQELKEKSLDSIIKKDGFYSSIFPILEKTKKESTTSLSVQNYKDLVLLSDKFEFAFHNSGISIKNSVYTCETTPIHETPTPLRSIIQTDSIPIDCYLKDNIDKYEYLKGSKKIERISKIGIKYNYSEGSMTFPDSLDMPGRTMLTSEGSVNRSTHVIKDERNNLYRLLTPIEAERLNDFPDNWTDTGMTNNRRYFMMGNALVTGIVKRIGIKITSIINNEK